MNTLPCIICKKELEPTDDSQTHIQPNSGIVVSTQGSYGSRVYDSAFEKPDRALVFTICDACLILKGSEGLIGEYVAKSDATFWKADLYTILWTQSETHEEYEQKLKDAGLEY